MRSDAPVCLSSSSSAERLNMVVSRRLQQRAEAVCAGQRARVGL